MPAAEGMKVFTNTRRVRDARRNVVELLLSEHNGECQTCDRNEDCELQALAAELGIREIAYAGEKTRKRIDVSTPCPGARHGQVHQVPPLRERCAAGNAKRRRAVSAESRVRDGHRPGVRTRLEDGRLRAVRPVRGRLPGGRDHRAGPDRRRLEGAGQAGQPRRRANGAPAIRAALGECFGYPPGTLVTGKMVAALRRMGFDAVFDTNFAADLTIMEEGTELLTRLKAALVGVGDGSHSSNPLPMFTSCSPGWIKYHGVLSIPDMLVQPFDMQVAAADVRCGGQDLLCREARQAARTDRGRHLDHALHGEEVRVPAARRWIRAVSRDVDIVLTTRELGKMIHAAGIDFGKALPDDEMDAPLGTLQRCG